MPTKPMRCMIAAALALVASRAEATGTGMYLCPSPVIADAFWTNITPLVTLRVSLFVDMIRSLAAKDECGFAASQSLRPVDFVAGNFLMTDGTMEGWADPHLYIRYVNSPQKK